MMDLEKRLEEKLKVMQDKLVWKDNLPAMLYVGILEDIKGIIELKKTVLKGITKEDTHVLEVLLFLCGQKEEAQEFKQLRQMFRAKDDHYERVLQSVEVAKDDLQLDALKLTTLQYEEVESYDTLCASFVSNSISKGEKGAYQEQMQSTREKIVEYTKQLKMIRKKRQR